MASDRLPSWQQSGEGIGLWTLGSVLLKEPFRVCM